VLLTCGTAVEIRPNLVKKSGWSRTWPETAGGGAFLQLPAAAGGIKTVKNK